MYRLLGDQSLWSGYLQSLPLESELSIGLFWGSGGSMEDIDTKEARQWFSGTEVEQFLLHHPDPGVAILVRSMDSFSVLWHRPETIAFLSGQEETEEYYRGIASPLLASLDVSHTTLEGFRHAYSLVSSRAFMVDAYHGLAMVPIADA